MVLEMKTTDLLEAISSPAPTPGGGGATAAVGAFAAALGLMVANLTIGKKKYRDVEDEILEVRAQLEKLRDELVSLVDEDVQAFTPLSEAYRLPQNTEEERKKRMHIMEQALYDAAMAPLKVMETILKAIHLLEVLCIKGSRLAVSDAGIGMLFAESALEGAALNVYINTKMMQNSKCAEEMNERADEMVCKGRKLKDKIYEEVLAGVR